MFCDGDTLFTDFSIMIL